MTLFPALALALSLAAPAAGDWLVTRDGTRLETDGPWSVRGKIVVFTAADGTLSSLRLSEVDLEASAAATAEPPAPPAAPAEPAPPPRREPVLVLTDADVAHVREPPATAEPEAESGEDEDAAGLEVQRWTSDLTDQGVRVTGALANTSGDVHGTITLTVHLLDRDEKLLASGEATLSASALRPGQTAEFQADVPGVFTFEDARFETASIALLARPDETVGAGDEAPVEQEGAGDAG